MNVTGITRNIATTSSPRRRWYRYHRQFTWKCRVSSSSSSVANSPCTTPWMWNRDRLSPNQRPSASRRPRSCSYTPDVQIPSPACNWRLRQLLQLRPVQPSKCTLLQLSVVSICPRNTISTTELYNFQYDVLLNRYRYFVRDVFRTQICLIKHNKFDMWAPIWTNRFLRWKGLRQSIIIFVTKSPFWREA